ncbi:four-jointed box protein 1 [Tachysurus fulvidraco]|uniref:four-jointed box protein 1 n=1 Tax=Tachysurus fulvidraco TaxID=1234273 RepID=UPI000F4E7333|nr:four-jointed box protein 1 [Tachysurus fulvidraco]
MKAVCVNLASLLLLCACAGVLHFWSGFQKRLERNSRSVREHSVHPDYPDPSPDLSGTFRALLAVPTDSKLHPDRNISNDETVSLRRKANGRRFAATQRELHEAENQTEQFLEDGIYWSQRLDDGVSMGFGEEDARSWRQRVRRGRVVSLEPGCGRTSNQLATFSDGSRACVRYGINSEQVQGETLSYYLAALLGITNVPPLALLRLDGEQWMHVRRRMEALQWTPSAVVSLSEWVAELSPAVVPAPFHRSGQGLRPLLPQLQTKTKAELLELVQWSDLILFDYITANFDRLVSNLFSLQWDAKAMERDASNLLRTPRGSLVFIDNEAGLVHGYRVLDMWEKYHSAALSSVCVFRRKTARRVADLHRRRDTRARLLQLYRDSEPLAPELGFLSDEHTRILQDRIDRIHEHILHCKEKHDKL